MDKEFKNYIKHFGHFVLNLLDTGTYSWHIRQTGPIISGSPLVQFHFFHFLTKFAMNSEKLNK